MIEEVFKPIQGYEGLYEVSNLGRVKSLGNGGTCNSSEHLLNPGCNNSGYLFVSLWKVGVHKQFLVHRLVAETFIPNPDNLPCVNHKDFNKHNNCVVNLEFCSAKYNTQYSLGYKIKMLDLNTNNTIYFDSLRDTARYLQADHHTISKYLNNKRVFRNQYKFSEP